MALGSFFNFILPTGDSYILKDIYPFSFVMKSIMFPFVLWLMLTYVQVQAVRTSKSTKSSS